MLEVKGKASETFFIKIRALAVLAVGWIKLWDLKRIEKRIREGLNHSIEAGLNYRIKAGLNLKDWSRLNLWNWNRIKSSNRLILPSYI